MTVVHKPDGTVNVQPRTDLLRRCEVTSNASTALVHLQTQMAVATELTESLGDHGRAGIFRSMVALLDFCSSQGVPRAALYPLELVAGALVDADRGVTTPAFRPDCSPGRPPIPSYEIAPRAYRAVVAECCIRHARSTGVKAFKKDGLSLAVRLLRQASWEPQLTAAQLDQLREEVTARPPDDPIRSQFDLMMESQLVRAIPLDYAKTLLQHGFVNKPPDGPQL